MEKKYIMLGMFVGTTAGGYLPVLWGGNVFSFTSIILGVIGGIVGIWGAHKLVNSF